MRSNDGRGWLVVGTWLGIALVAGACSKAPGDDDANDTSGSGGSQQASAPVGSGGAGHAAPAATGGAPAVVNTGSGGGGVVNAATGGATATEGSGGVAAGTGGATEEVTDGGMMPPPAREDLGMGDGKDVVTIGDSWMNILTNGGGIEGGLDRAGTSYRHYAVAGTTLAGTIPGQYDQAKAANPEIKTVIMTGGGNDVMYTGGCNTKEACEQAVLQIVANLNTLWTKMADDGVKDVFYIQYSKNVGTAPSDTRPDKPPPPPEICLSGKITCHTVMTTDLVGPSDSIDGIHPTLAACDLIAARVLDDMETTGSRR